MSDIIVIGAGLSGLSAGLLLSNSGLRVTILEADDHVGGRTLTVRDPKCGGHVDLGGAYFGPSMRRLLELSKQFNVKIRDDKRSVYRYHGDWLRPPSFLFHPLEATDVHQILRRLELMTSCVPVNDPWVADRAREWDSMTLKEFLDRTCWTERARRVVTIACEILMCTEPHSLSLLSFLWFMSCNGGIRRLISAFTAEHEWRFTDGADQVCTNIAKVLSDSIHLSSPVIRIEKSYDDENVMVSSVA